MARRFRFRLETVRKLREQARDRRRRVVADAVNQVARIEERISRLTIELRNTIKDTRTERLLKRIDVLSLREHQLYRGRLHRKILEAGAELTRSKAALGQERVKLGEASRQLKVIEKLRDRQWQRHRTQQQREEQNLYDEAALQLYVRRQRQHDQEVRA